MRLSGSLLQGDKVGFTGSSGDRVGLFGRQCPAGSADILDECCQKPASFHLVLGAVYCFICSLVFDWIFGRFSFVGHCEK